MSRKKMLDILLKLRAIKNSTEQVQITAARE